MRPHPEGSALLDPRLDRAPCGYLALSDEGSVLKANATLLSLLGRGAGEVVGTRFASLLSPGAAIFCQTHLFPLLRLRGRADEIYLSLRTRGGDDLPVLLNAVRVSGAEDGGAPGEVITECVLVLVRQRSEFEDELLRAKRELEEARGALEKANRGLERAAARDRTIAATLQGDLLPAVAPDRVPGFEVWAFHRPLLHEAEVGGDFFDVFPLGGGRWALAVGDVAGKGLAAALSIAEVKFALRAFLREGEGGDMPRALDRLNRSLVGSNRLERRSRSVVAALSVAVADPGTGRLLVATAGAESPLLVRGRGTESDTPARATVAIDAGGMILGASGDEVYQAAELLLAPGDLLALPTDGLTEARDPLQKRIFGEDRLSAALLRAADLDLDRAGPEAIEEARSFAGGAFQDDVCLLLARFQGA